jgi:glycosyltransferase involved in cell wall biosynthesis
MLLRGSLRVQQEVFVSGAELGSVVINNYNYGRFLEEAIDSALNQTYPEIEGIVVDDGSTDNSRDVIESYGDEIMPVPKENKGQENLNTTWIGT